MVENTSAYSAKTITVDGRTVDYLEGGSGPHLVFMHGGGGRPVWPFHEQLTDEFHVIMMEQPGFGGTPEIDATQSDKDYATVVKSWADAIVAEPYHLGGHSFGGRTAAWMAVLAGDSALSLSLQAPGIIVPDGIVIPLPPSPDGSAPTDQQKSQGALVSRLVGTRNPELEAGIAALPIPVTVLLGENDGLFPPALAADYEAAFPSATVEVVAGASHVISLNEPVLSVQAIVSTASAAEAAA